MSKYDDMASKAQYLLGKYNKDKIKRLINKNIFYSHKINSYIPESFDLYKNKIYDKIAELNYQQHNYNNNSQIINIVIDKYPDMFSEEQTYWWILKNKYNRSNAYFFIAKTEDDAFKSILIKMARYTNWVPKIENNKIVGDINQAIIMKVMLKYDQQYGLLLKSIYENQKI